MSPSTWRRRIKTFCRRLGYDVVRFHPESSDAAKVHAVLRHLGTDLVLDVGANEGQYGGSLREMGYRGRLVSFEPLSSAHAVLQRRAAQDPLWLVHPRCALGDQEGEISIHIAGNNVSSSVLPMLEQHARAAPDSRYIGQERVLITRLDSVAPAYLADARGLYLKIDTQGYEALVLAGAAQVLAQCRAVQLELSLVPLYESQALWEQLIAELRASGFELWTVLLGFVEPDTGRSLQIDAIFVRR